MLTCLCRLLAHCSVHCLECCTLQFVFDLENIAINSDKVVKFLQLVHFLLLVFGNGKLWDKIKLIIFGSREGIFYFV